MKLIDLLVQELPKRGGWPEGADYVVQDGDGSIDVKFGAGEATLEHDQRGVWVNNITPDWGIDTRESYIHDFKILACDASTAIITREQYESAIAASQKAAWNGEGLPPVGMHCEIVDHDGVLMYGQGESGEVIAHVENTAVIRMSYGLGCFEARFLQPSHSEAERKRNAAIEAIDWFMPECIPDTPNEYYHAKKIYDAIAAGKIPGVKLDD